LSFVFEEEKDYHVFELTDKKYFNQNISRTFHGRDVFAPVAAHLSKGVETDKLGREITDFVRFKTDKPRKISENETEAEIIYADNFGNLITNLTKNDLPERFVLEIKEIIIEKYLEFFAQAGKGELFMILGSAGFLEIAAFKDSAKKILNVKAGDRVLIKKVK
jgi:S-adenosylmethionine hydrolase